MATIRDVAQCAGVSQVTVSRVVNGAANVNPETRARVEHAIEALGYVPNVAAGSLRSKRTHSLALLVPDITNPFWTTIARGVEDAAQRSDTSVLLCNTDENPDKQERYLHAVISHRVDGVIIAPHTSDAESLPQLRRRRVPTVIIDRCVPGWEVDSVTTDSVAGSLAIARRLLSQGHRRIAMISGPVGTSTADDRVTGYCLALIEAGIPVDHRYIKRGEFRPEAGEALIGELFDQELAPTAVVAANNYIAMGVITGIEKRGLVGGKDIAVACYEEIPNGERFCPWVTALIQPAYDMGVNAAQLLLSQIEQTAPSIPRHVLLPVRMLTLSASAGGDVEPKTALVKPLSAAEKALLPLARLRAGLDPTCRSFAEPASGPDEQPQSDVARLLNAVRHQESDCVPHFEVAPVPASLYSRIVGAGDRDSRAGRRQIEPDEHVRLALQLGWDAAPCHLVGTDVTEHLNRVEAYARATRDTRLGIALCFGSFCDPELNDAEFERYLRSVRAVCDRFAGDVALVLLSETIATAEGLTPPAAFLGGPLGSRLQRVVGLIKEHGLPVGIRTAGKLDAGLDTVRALGFDLVHFLQPERNDIGSAIRQWGADIAFAGALPSATLTTSTPAGITDWVRAACELARGQTGYVLNSAAGRFDGVPAQNIVALAHAAKLHGRRA